MLISGVYSLYTPLDMGLPQCQNGCKYCYSKKIKSITVDTFRTIQNVINKEYDGSLKSYFMKNRYPVCINNRSDIFSIKQSREYLQMAKLLHDAGFPLLFETKGFHHTWQEKYFFNNFDPGKTEVYITITTLSDYKRREIEPNAPSIMSRIKMCDNLMKEKYTFEIGINPYIDNFINKDEIIWLHNRYKCCIFIAPYHGNAKKQFKSKTYKDIQIHFDGKKYPFWFGRPSSGNMHFEEHFKKVSRKKYVNAIVIDMIFKKIYEQHKKETDNLIVSDFEGFYKEAKDFFPDCNVKRSEIWLGKTYGKSQIDFLSKLPKEMTYKDFIKLQFQLNRGIIKYTHLLSLTKDGDLCYFYPNQPIVSQEDRYE